MKPTEKKQPQEMGMDTELLEISGSAQNYSQDMQSFEKSLSETLKKMRSTKYGKEKLKKAGLK